MPPTVAYEVRSQRFWDGMTIQQYLPLSNTTSNHLNQSLLLTQEGQVTPQPIADIITALLDEDPRIRELAFEDLRAIETDVALSILKQALENENWQYRVIAAYTLGRLGLNADAAVPALNKALKDPNPDVRFSVAQALGKINSEEAVPLLIEALQDEDENVQFAVTDTLIQLGAKVGKFNISLMRFLENHQGASYSYSYPSFTIADALKPESRFAIPIFSTSLTNSNWFIRNRGVAALSHLEVDSTIPVENTLWVSASIDGFARSTFIDTFLRKNFNKLIQILQISQNHGNRQIAAEVLGLIGSKQAIPYLIEAIQKETSLEAPEVTVRQEAALALGRLQAEEAVPVLAEALRQFIPLQNSLDSLYELKYTYTLFGPLVSALERIGTMKAIEALSAIIPDKRMYFLSSSVLRKISKREVSEEEGITFLLNILESGDIDAIGRVIYPSESVRSNFYYLSAIEASVERLGLESIFSILKPILLKDDNSWGADPFPMIHRVAAAKILSMFGNDAVQTIVESLSPVEAFSVFAEVRNNDDASVNQFADAILEKVSAEIFPELVMILKDDSDNRAEAARMLRYVKSKDAIPFLVKVLDSHDSNLVVESLLALGKIGSAEAVPEIIRALQNEERSIRWCSAISLGWIGEDQSVPALIQALHDDEVEVRNRSAEALGNIGSLEAEIALIEALSDESYDVRAFAAEALGRIKSRAAIPALVNALKDKSWAVRLKASSALSILTPESITYLIEALENFQTYPRAIQTALQDKNADFRRSISYVFWEMGLKSNDVMEELTEVVTNEADNLGVRWMIAAALQNAGHNMSWFFTENNLSNPRNLLLSQCPNDLYDAEWDAEVSISDFPDEFTVDSRKLMYAGRCIYGDKPQGGGTIFGFYQQLRNLLNKG